MADATSRTLALLGLLQTHRFWTGSQLSERLAVSERTIRRDVERLRVLGYPVAATPGVSGGYQLAAGAHLPPLLVDDDEAVALAVGLRTAAGSAIAEVEETAVRVMAKLEQILPDRLRRRVEAIHASTSVLRWSPDAATVAAGTLVTLATGCRDREEVRFEYRRRDGEESRRLVRPHELVAAGRRWYLVAWDVRRLDWRTFRVDRIREPVLAGVRFPALELPAADSAAFVAESLSAATRVHRAVVEVTGATDEVDRLTRWIDAVVEHRAADTSRVELRAETVEWLAAMIAMLATSFPLRIVDAPAAARERVASAAARLA